MPQTIPPYAPQGRCRNLKETSQIAALEESKFAGCSIPRETNNLVLESIQDHTSQQQDQILASCLPKTSASSKKTCSSVKTRDDSPGSQELSKHRTVSKVWKYISRSVGRLNNVIFAIVSYGVTSYFAVAAPLVYSPLGSFSPTHGVLALHILAKISDIGLGLAVASMWESVQWSSVFAGLRVSVPAFFALNGSTGFLGLVRMLVSKSRIGHASRLWSLARMIAILTVPGPGTIFMSDVKVTDLYFPLNWSNITGGVGVFNASLINDFATLPAPRISALVQYFLSDTTISFPMTPPINNSCGLSSSTCVSFLIPGGMSIVSPWQFASSPQEALSYIIKNGPAYQLDFGGARAGASWPSDACKLYRSENYGFQMCIEADQSTNQLVAGWRTCSTYDVGFGLCNQTWENDATNVWLTSMATYRRKATVTAVRSSFDILEVSDLSTPVAQVIHPTDLFSILDTILTPAQIGTSNQTSPAYALSDYLFELLHLASSPSAQAMTQPVQILRNLLVTPLYLCNAVILTGTSSMATLQTGLPAENQLLGADAIRVTRAVPGQLTVWIYIASAGTILLTAFIVICVSSRVQTPKTSSFPIADFLMLTRVDTRGWRDGLSCGSTSFEHDGIFASVQKFGDNSEILRWASNFSLDPNRMK